MPALQAALKNVKLLFKLWLTTMYYTVVWWGSLS